MTRMYRIMVNTYIGGYRRQQRRPVLALTGEVPASAAPSAEAQAIAQITDPDISAAVRVLPEKYRTAVYYADIEGWKSREIAALTHVPVGTVMSRLHRGRAALRHTLAGVAGERGYVLPGAA